MKRFIPFILIAAFLFPVIGHAAAAPKSTPATTVQTPATTVVDINSPILKGKTLADKQKTVGNALNTIYSQLSDLSSQTQLAISQIDANGLDTAKAQADLLLANTSLAKAKADIAAFSAISTSKNSASYTLDALKYAANTTENSLRDAKSHLLDTLTELKALLPVLDTTDQS